MDNAIAVTELKSCHTAVAWYAVTAASSATYKGIVVIGTSRKTSALMVTGVGLSAVTDVKAVQRPKAQISILVSVFGKVIDVKAVQL